MTATVHRIVLFISAVAGGIAGIAGLSDLAGVDVVSYIALSGVVAAVIGNSWRILFPDAPAGGQ